MTTNRHLISGTKTQNDLKAPVFLKSGLDLELPRSTLYNANFS